MSGFQRNNLEKFYTKQDIAKKCVDIFINTINPDENDIIIEPSAGTGSFSDYLKDKFPNTFAYDLVPEKSYILQQDYLQFSLPTGVIEKKHVIGNPPFGRQSQLVRKFVKKSAEFADTISFILPKSFKKQSFKKAFPLNYHLKHQIELPNNSFTINGKSHNVPCVFQIWELKNSPRPIALKPQPIFYKFVKKTDENVDFSIRRVGGTAGKLDSNYQSKSSSSHYFIALDPMISKEGFTEKYNKLVFETNNTVGPKSISKPELISKINSLLN